MKRQADLYREERKNAQRGRREVKLLLLSMFLLAGTVAIAAESFPGGAPSRTIIKTQEKVDSLFERGKYERALFIYRHELAPLGDKYAQYMIGYMHLTGKGVDGDLATAAAWYRLAAERRQDTFVREHDKLMSLLSAEQRARADEAYVALRSELGDAALIVQLVEDDLEALSNRIKGISFSLDTASRGNFDRQNSINEQTAERIRARMKYLGEKLESDDSVVEAERQHYAELKPRVQRELGEFEASR